MAFKSAVAFCFIFYHYLNVASTSQQCLTSPPPLRWNYKNGVYRGSLFFDANQFTINGVTFTTRVHNGMLPSPTLYMKSGETYKLSVRNNLEYEPPNNTMHVVKEPNYTNVHTHGLHISGESPADNIFNPIIPGGNTIEYTYEIPSDHSGGTMWYHPHHHGSTTIQVGGGCAGALIVEDNEKELESFPEWYKSLTETELVLMIQHLDLAEMATYGYIDNVFWTSKNTSFWTVNGEYQPTICLKTNVWRKWRMLHVDVIRPVTLEILGSDYPYKKNSCEVYLLSKDGVLIHGLENEAPRYIASNKMYFTVAGRADIAIKCSEPGMYKIMASGAHGDGIIANIMVSGKRSTNDVELTLFNPLRPRYLQSLLFYNGVYNQQNIHLDGRTINDESFMGQSHYQFVLSARSINEWNVSGSDVHPFHTHINHFQLHSYDANMLSVNIPGWTEIGDWMDTLGGFDAIVRFKADRFGGRMILHCHRLRHEDEGQMAVVLIDGGCDGNGGNFGTGIPSCHI